MAACVLRAPFRDSRECGISTQGTSIRQCGHDNIYWLSLSSGSWGKRTGHRRRVNTTARSARMAPIPSHIDYTPDHRKAALELDVHGDVRVRPSLRAGCPGFEHDTSSLSGPLKLHQRR